MPPPLTCPTCEPVREKTEALTWNKKAGFPGLLVPPRPNPEELQKSETPLGSLKKLRGLVIQKGPFDSIFIRAGCIKNAPWVELWNTVRQVVTYYVDAEKERLRKSIKDFEEGVVAKKASPRAVYIAVSPDFSQSIDLGHLVGQGFHFHHHRAPGHGATPTSSGSVPEASVGDSELVYVVEPAIALGMKGMVPSYSTSIEGATAICLSPDGTKVLLVWERGNWGTPGGAVDPGECKVETLRRELEEEVGVELDEEDGRSQYLGGGSTGRARDNLSNDSFSAFVVHVKSEEHQVDHQEINEAEWFVWKPLLDTWRGEGSKVTKKVEMDLGKPKGDKAERNIIAGNVMLGLDIYERGKGHPLKIKRETQGPHSVMKATWGSLAV